MSYILREMPTWLDYIDDYGYYRVERYDGTHGNKRPKIQHKNQNVKSRKQKMEKEKRALTREV